MRKVALLFSAGVESSCLLFHYAQERELVLPVYVRFGFEWESTEYVHAQKLWLYLKKRFPNILPPRVTFLKGVRKKGELEIPLRNFLLVSAIASTALKRGIKRIALGSLGAYPFPDNNRAYFDRLEELISTGIRDSFSIETPFMRLEKEDIVRRFYRRFPLNMTFSCIEPVKGMHCGRCIKCSERQEGFKRAGIEDPTLYVFSAPPES